MFTFTSIIIMDKLMTTRTQINTHELFGICSRLKRKAEEELLIFLKIRKNLLQTESFLASHDAGHT